MAQGTHDFVPDPRNDAILINVNGTLVPRAEASVSVFDSGFMLGVHWASDILGGTMLGAAFALLGTWWVGLPSRQAGTSG